mmetsp:Transcript_50700/g.151721  ORF Transcript_50700/g.151721 Transcript_50700/m.151721 type:complete len:303 (+) Transcript_50700:687-1595(+)
MLETSCKSSAYLEPSATVCESSARLSVNPVAAKAPPMSAWIGDRLLGSRRATSATRRPCASASRATSRPTVAPKEWPAKKYGPEGWTFRTSSKKSAAKSCSVAGHSPRGRRPLGQERPYAGTGSMDASARKPPDCMPAPGMRKSGVPAERSFRRSSICSPLEAAGALAAAAPALGVRGAADSWPSPNSLLMNAARPLTVGWSKISELGILTPSNSVTRRLRNSTPDSESMPDSSSGASVARSSESTTCRAMSRRAPRTAASRSSKDRPASARAPVPPSAAVLAGAAFRASASKSARKRGGTG